MRRQGVESTLWAVDCKSNVLATALPSHLQTQLICIYRKAERRRIIWNNSYNRFDENQNYYNDTELILRKSTQHTLSLAVTYCCNENARARDTVQPIIVIRTAFLYVSMPFPMHTFQYSTQCIISVWKSVREFRPRRLRNPSTDFDESQNLKAYPWEAALRADFVLDRTTRVVWTISLSVTSAATGLLTGPSCLQRGQTRSKMLR